MEGTRDAGQYFSPRTAVQRRAGSPDRTQPQAVTSEISPSLSSGCASHKLSNFRD